jgi:hypothetical protein
MTDEQFERYMELAKRLFQQMRRTGEWPWTDKPDFLDERQAEMLAGDDPGNPREPSQGALF